MNSLKGRVRHNFDRGALHYQEYSAAQQALAATLLERCGAALPTSGIILDVGAGDGVLGLLATTPMVAVDLSFAMCQRAQAYYRYVLQGDAEALPFCDGSVAAVVSSAMVQWLEEPVIFFNEVARVLAPHGVAALAVLVEGTLREVGDARREALTQCGLPVAAATPLPSVATLDASIMQSGLEIEHSSDWEGFTWHPSPREALHALSHAGVTATRDGYHGNKRFYHAFMQCYAALFPAGKIFHRYVAKIYRLKKAP